MFASIPEALPTQHWLTLMITFRIAKTGETALKFTRSNYKD